MNLKQKQEKIILLDNWYFLVGCITVVALFVTMYYIGKVTFYEPILQLDMFPNAIDLPDPLLKKLNFNLEVPAHLKLFNFLMSLLGVLIFATVMIIITTAIPLGRFFSFVFAIIYVFVAGLIILNGWVYEFANEKSAHKASERMYDLIKARDPQNAYDILRVAGLNQTPEGKYVLFQLGVMYGCEGVTEWCQVKEMYNKYKAHQLGLEPRAAGKYIIEYGVQKQLTSKAAIDFQKKLLMERKAERDAANNDHEINRFRMLLSGTVFLVMFCLSVGFYLRLKFLKNHIGAHFIGKA